jgi:hypothetical protein
MAISKDEMHGVIFGFLHEIIENSSYYVFHKTKPVNTVALKNGFRPTTKSTGNNRSKVIHLQFTAIAPSQEEVDAYVDSWARSKIAKYKDSSESAWEQILMVFMDDFVLDFTIAEHINPYRDVKLIRGYNKAMLRKDMEESVVSFNVKYLQPRREDIEKFARMWLQEQGWFEA